MREVLRIETPDSETPQRQRAERAHHLGQKRRARTRGVEKWPAQQQLQQNNARAPRVDRGAERASHQHLMVGERRRGGKGREKRESEKKRNRDREKEGHKQKRHERRDDEKRDNEGKGGEAKA